ncbi:phosphoribosylglycinamide formyltransferase [Hydrogenimonas urashimensis]|uniref:phosphoribosylglycinamide formyltransferase n=1 Tax=Hydrogenimonas urashimensis TaxID=2740515 RepID=UPI001F47C34B|nr:phosphoribosylglycinamide formyltransferase [Hydrogenimonas urashimensis]
MARDIKIAVLFSGEGTNLENLIRHFHGKRFGEKTIGIVPITNRPEAGGIERAKRHGIDTIVIDHRDFPNRESFDGKLVETLRALAPDLVVMAGFMRILTPVFTSQIEAINLHPSLLPLFKGADAIRKSFESGMKVGGVTIHRVTQELDSGKILAQSCVSLENHDTLESFTHKIRQTEYRLLPETIRELLGICGW